jgi:MFS transporter, DHA1 family, tetracycline resistance protein
MKRSSISSIVLFALFLDTAAVAMLLPVLPKLLQHHLNGNISLAAFYYSLFLTVTGVILYFVGPIQAALADIYGRKNMLITATAGSAVSFLLLAIAPNLPLLFLAQILFAVSGASSPVASCYIADQSDENSRSKNFSLLASMHMMGFIVGASLGGLFGQLSLQLSLILAMLISVAAIILFSFFMKESLPPTREPHRRLNFESINPIAASKFLFSRSNLAEINFVMLCADFAFQAFLCTWVLFTTLKFHWTIAQAGSSLSLEGLFGIVAQTALMRYALPRLGVRKTLLFALSFDALALLLYNFADGASLLVVAIIAIHCSGCAVRPTCVSALAEAVQPEEQSRLQGAIGSQYALTALIGPLLGTWLFSVCTSPTSQVNFPGVSMFLGFCALVAAAAVTARPLVTQMFAQKGAIPYLVHAVDEKSSN